MYSPNWERLTNRAVVKTDRYEVESNTVVVKNGRGYFRCPCCGHLFHCPRGCCWCCCPHCRHRVWNSRNCRCWYHCPRCGNTFRFSGAGPRHRCPRCRYGDCYPDCWR